MPETAALALDENGKMAGLGGFWRHIFAACNIADGERSADFWTWFEGFPQAAAEVMQNPGFHAYWRWENAWLAKKREELVGEWKALGAVLERCMGAYAMPVRRVAVLLLSIKCAYSADYHTVGQTLYFPSGRFSGGGGAARAIAHGCRACGAKKAGRNLAAAGEMAGDRRILLSGRRGSRAMQRV